MKTRSAASLCGGLYESHPPIRQAYADLTRQILPPLRLAAKVLGHVERVLLQTRYSFHLDSPNPFGITSAEKLCGEELESTI